MVIPSRDRGCSQTGGEACFGGSSDPERIGIGSVSRGWSVTVSGKIKRGKRKRLGRRFPHGLDMYTDMRWR